MIIEIFRLGSPKGLKGLQKIHYISGEQHIYGREQRWYIHQSADQQWVPVDVDYLCSKYIKLNNVNSIDGAREHTHHIVGMQDHDLPLLEEDEHYYRDLIGKAIINHDNKLLGTVLEVINSPANDILVFEHKSKRHLIPFIAEYVLEVSKTIHVYWDTNADWYH